MFSRLRSVEALVTLAALSTACQGEDPRAGAAGSGGGSGVGGAGAAAAGLGSSDPRACALDAAVAATPLRRLTRTQYDNTVRDLLGLATHEAAAFPDDDRVGAFPANPRQSVTDAHVRRFMDAAEHLADQLDAAALRKLAGCAAATADDACADQLIQVTGSRGYRRPLSQEQALDLRAVYQLGKQGGGFESGARLMIEALLASPSFLYHVELKPTIGGTSANVPLSDWELASRLSYFLWQTLPDAELVHKAEAGELSDAVALEQQAKRLLADARAEQTLAYFTENWLGIASLQQLTRDSAKFPTFDATQARAMRDETLAFVKHVFQSDASSLSELFTASYSFVPDALLPVYGLTRPDRESATDALQLDPTERAGLLLQPSVLAAHAPSDHTSPVKRGVFILSDILCHEIKPPVGIKVPELPPLDPNQTTRERFLQHEQPGCSGCHAPIDHLGFTFEHYDSVGAFRETDGGKAINDSGSLEIGSSVDGPVAGATEMAKKIASAPELGACVVRQWHRFALGRSESDADACSLHSLETNLESSGSSLRELVLAIPLQNSFRLRPANPQ